jgi:hypothetical protein
MLTKRQTHQLLALHVAQELKLETYPDVSISVSIHAAKKLEE